MTDDDRRLVERLRRYEASVPEEPLPTTVSFNRRPPWMGIAAIGAAAVLAGAVIAGNVLDNQDGVGETDSTPTASPTATSTPSGTPEASASASGQPSASPSPAPETPSVAPEVTPAPSISGVAWTDGVGKVSPGRVFRITAEGGRFHALGSVGRTATIWSSADATTWESVSLPSPSSWDDRDTGFHYVEHLAAVGERLVAIGTIGINDYLEVVVWESTNGTSWQEVDTGVFRTDAFKVVDVSAGPGGLVVITHDYAAGTGSAWRSPDGGRSWSEHRPPGANLGLQAVVGTGRGLLVAGAVGETYDNVTTSSPRIWHSADGTNWTAADVEGSGGRGQVEALTLDGSGVWVATGTLNDRSVAWRSTDRGLTWQMTADLGTGNSGNRADFRLTGAPGGYIAFRASDPTDIWTSPDGVSWSVDPSRRPSGVPDGMSIGWTSGIARIGDAVVVAGHSHSDEGSPDEWLFWVGTIQR